MIHPRIFLVLLIVALCLLILGTAPPPSPTGPGSIVDGAQMLEPRSRHTATLLPDVRVLITGGMRRNQDFYRSAELFDPATGKESPEAARLERPGLCKVVSATSTRLTKRVN